MYTLYGSAPSTEEDDRGDKKKIGVCVKKSKAISSTIEYNIHDT